MYRPLPPYLTIKQSSVEGLGLFATKPIRKSKNLGISHVSDKWMDNGYIRTPLGGFINHNDTPNCKKFKEGRFLSILTITDIKEGEELTLNYSFYNPS
tara:strand:- start:2 stop:295 length:294 start_codon:yes stop_codon:yes gene_type:complete